MAHYTYELERRENGILIICTLHYYYAAECGCGHENFEEPGEGYESVLDGRKRNVKLTEYTIVGPMLAAFIAALSRRSGMSRTKIQEHLRTWMNFDLSVGLICKSIREAGIACYPVVDELIDDLQKEEHVHLDETPWYQKGLFCWLWVALGKTTAIYHVGTRKKTELLTLITEAFVGWLITDGYGAYRSYEKRQRCLAHLIRKAVRLTGAVAEDVQKNGDWFLREMRGLIKAMAQGEAGRKECRPILARLKRACNLGSKSDHANLKALANEILNDWDAVVAFVKNPGLPATNNAAERALRWAVMFRKITFGTRTSEGSRSFAALLSVMETCRLRNVDPWDYIAKVIALGRKGMTPPPIA
jgi:IS1 family transposase